MLRRTLNGARFILFSLFSALAGVWLTWILGINNLTVSRGRDSL